MMIKAIILISGVLLIYTTARSEVNAKGALDVYWNTNMNSGQSGGAYEPLDHDDFQVGLATINFSGSSKNVDYYLELAYGDQAGGTAAGTSGGLSQAYLTHYVNQQISVVMGRMDSNVGLEGNLAKNNMNYSHSLGFNYGGPNYGEGIAVRYSNDSGLGAALFYYDGPDQLTDSGTTNAYSAQLSYKKEKLSAIYNYFHEQDGLNSSIHDFIISYELFKELSLFTNIISGQFDEENLDGNWLSIALYFKYLLSQKSHLVLRLESWEQEDIALVGSNTDEKITSVTLTYGYKLESEGELRFELRQDTADNQIYRDSEGANEDGQMNFSTAWITRF